MLSKAALLFLSYLFINCQQIKPLPLTDKEETITIIINGFIKPPQRIKLGEGIFVNNISTIFTIWDSFNKRDVPSDSISFNDTLRFKLTSNLGLVQHKFNGISETSYLLKAGDTLKISFTDEIPRGYLLSSQHNIIEKTISQSLRDSSLSENSVFSSYESYTYPIMGLSLYDNNFKSIVESKKKLAFAAARKNFSKEIDYLATLEKGNLISKETFLMFSNRAYYLSNLIELEQDNLSEDSIKKIILNDIFNSPELPYSFLQDFLDGLVRKKIIASVKLVKSANGSIADYREVYDKIEQSDALFKGKYKELLLFKYLELIAKSFSVTDFKKYANKFLETASSNYLKNKINEKYFLDFDELRLLSDSLYLLSFEKEKLTFKTLLSQNKNKLIYIDFWASWCIPCRQAMPDSKTLRDKYKSKDITFIYLSIDKNFEDWQKASLLENIATYQESYIVINPSASKYLKTLNVETIPRYLLFNSQGILEHADAPGPGSKDLHEKIDKLLSK